jgi:hypothetical protein
VLSSAEGDVTIRLAGIVHATIDIGDPGGDFVDEVVVRQLPQDGPWPVEAHHLLRHHNSRSPLHWLTITGPSEVEILAEALSVGSDCPADCGALSSLIGHDGVDGARSLVHREGWCGADQRAT